MKLSKKRYNKLLDNTGMPLEHARQNTFNTVNIALVKANWELAGT